jgi:hypothetical protein
LAESGDRAAGAEDDREEMTCMEGARLGIEE